MVGAGVLILLCSFLLCVYFLWRFRI
jgi:hypothetical protein